MATRPYLMDAALQGPSNGPFLPDRAHLRDIGLSNPVGVAYFTLMTPAGREMVDIVSGHAPSDPSCPVRYAFLDVLSTGLTSQVNVIPMPAHCAAYTFRNFGGEAVSILEADTGRPRAVFLMGRFQAVDLPGSGPSYGAAGSAMSATYGARAMNPSL